MYANHCASRTPPHSEFFAQCPDSQKYPKKDTISLHKVQRKRFASACFQDVIDRNQSIDDRAFNLLLSGVKTPLLLLFLICIGLAVILLGEPWAPPQHSPLWLTKNFPAPLPSHLQQLPSRLTTIKVQQLSHLLWFVHINCYKVGTVCYL